MGLRSSKYMSLNKQMSEISFKTYFGQYDAVNW